MNTWYSHSHSTHHLLSPYSSVVDRFPRVTRVRHRDMLVINLRTQTLRWPISCYQESRSGRVICARDW